MGEKLAMNETPTAKKTLTREGLKEILQINFELYKGEPDFFDYITTLIIYLMEYEYQGGARAGDQGSTRPPMPPSMRSISSTAPSFSKVNTVNTRCKIREGCCPNCNNPVPPDHKICPYCLSLIDH
jgi:hypothetical protein